MVVLSGWLVHANAVHKVANRIAGKAKEKWS